MSRFERILAPTWVCLILTAAGCAPDQGISGPTGAPAGYAPALRGAAIELRVDVARGTVSVAPAPVSSTTGGAGGGPSFALFGRNEIQATATNMTRSAVGAFTPNRVRVRFDLTLTNRLMNADLLPATFPTPPAAEVVAFAFSTDPAGLFGLKVRTSTDWDGAAHNFFNDAVCISITPPGDCFRWEGFGASLAPAASATRAVGFDVDPAVESFTVYVVVAADISERPIPPGTGGIAGVVWSHREGPQGVGVSIDQGVVSTVTDHNGFYSFSGIEPGTHFLRLGASPCESQAQFEVLVVAGEVTTASFEMICPLDRVGAIAGRVTTTLGDPLANVGLMVTPGGLVATTSVTGSYIFPDLTAGDYVVSVTNAPTGCGIGGLSTFVNVPPFTTGTADFIVPCVAPDPAVGSVIITELGQNPNDPSEQWIELYNTSSNPINLDHWLMGNGATATICLIEALSAGTIIDPGAVRTVINAPATTHADLANSMSCFPSGLAVQGQMTLISPDHTIIDEVETTRPGFPAAGLGKTFSLDPSAFDAVKNDVGASWCISTQTTDVGFGTPGSINPPCPQTIGLIRNAPDGTPVDVVGSVTASFSLGSGQYKTYIQDASGGIAVFPTAELTVGNSVQVTGARTVFRNEIQVAVSSVTDLEAFFPLGPRLIGPAEIQNGSADGQLVEVRNVTVFFVETSFRTICKVIFPDALTTLEIDCSSIGIVPNGTEFISVKGVLAREEFGVLRLRPRSRADIMF